MGHHGNTFLTFGVAPVGEVGGWVEIGRTTLGSEDDFITVSSLPDKRYYMTLNNIFATGNAAAEIRLNGDTGLLYPHRQSANGAADTSTAADNRGVEFNINLIGNQGFGVGYLANVATKEKLAINDYVAAAATGSAAIPNRQQSVWKHVQTTNPIDEVQSANIVTEGSGGFLTGSEEVVLAWDPSDTHTNNFWEELESTTFSGSASTFDTDTFTAKKYLWIQGSVKGTSSLRPGSFQFNTDTTTNYSIRRSHNGAGDATFPNLTSIDTQGGGSVTNYYFNMFVINNSSNEKLVIFNSTSFATAGVGTAPLRDELVGKWVNTASQITKLTVRSGDSGSLTSAEIKVWGSD